MGKVMKESSNSGVNLWPSAPHVFAIEYVFDGDSQVARVPAKDYPEALAFMNGVADLLNERHDMVVVDTRSHA